MKIKISQKINLLSCPRNVSTALMYSFAQRPDTRVSDEPFYAYFLKQNPGLAHPGREEVEQQMESDPDQIIRELNETKGKSIHFIKNMGHHMEGLEWDYLLSCKNILFIRKPEEIIRSYTKVIKQPSLRDIGMQMQWELHKYLKRKKAFFLVLDASDLLRAPEKTLKCLCREIRIPFFSHMLSWEPGPLPEDGSWAKHWYENVHQSTGWVKRPQKNSQKPLVEYLQPLEKEASLYYQKLYENRLVIS